MFEKITFLYYQSIHLLGYVNVHKGEYALLKLTLLSLILIIVSTIALSSSLQPANAALVTKTITLDPTSVSSNSTFTLWNAFPSGSNKVTDVTGIWNDPLNYIWSNINNNHQTFIFQTGKVDPSNIVTDVKLIVSAKKSAANPTKFSLTVTQGSTINDSPLGGMQATTSFANYTRDMTTNPFTNAAWTGSDLNLMTSNGQPLSFGVAQNTAAKIINVTKISLQITYQVNTQITISSVSPNPAKWGKTVTVNGTVTNPTTGETVTVLWGDAASSSSSSITIGGGGAWTATFAYPSGNVGTKTITAQVKDGVNTITSTTSPVQIIKHDTALSAAALSPSSVKWDKTFDATATLTDTDNSNSGISGKSLSFNGTGTSVGTSGSVPSSGNTGVTGTTPATTLTASGIGTVGTQNVNAKFAGDANYNPSSSNAAVTILKHDTAVTMPALGSPVKWSFNFTTTATLTDTDNSNSGISGESLTFDGSGVIGTVTSGFTNGTGTTPSTQITSAGKAAVGSQNVNATFAGDSNYNGNSISNSITIGPHNTSIFTPATLSYGSVRVGTTFPVNATLSDNDAGGTFPPLASSAVSAAQIKFNGTGVSADVFSTTDLTGLGSGIATAPNNAGAAFVNATFAGNSTYVGSTTSASITITAPHNTAIAITLNPSNPIWGGSLSVTGNLTDTNSNTPIPNASLVLSGNGTSGFTLSITTNANGTFTATGNAAGTSALNNWIFTVSYNGDTGHNPSTKSVTYSTTKHNTAINLSPIVIFGGNNYAGNPISVRGELLDSSVSNTGIPNKIITFSTTSTGSAFTVHQNTTNGITISDPTSILVDQCACPGTTNVIRLHADTTNGAVIDFPSNPAYVKLFLADMGGNTVTVTVTWGNGDNQTFAPSPAIGAGQIITYGIESAGISGSNPVASVGIKRIAFNSTSGGQVGISEIQTIDATLVQILDITFPSTVTNPISFNQGEYSSVATTPSTPITGTVTASFAGDQSYNLQSSVTQSFTTASCLSSCSGVGGVETATGPEVGQVITAATCISPDTLDTDNLCKSWKTTGIPYTYKVGGTGATTTKYYKLPGAVVGQNDTYYEIDSMTGKNPDPAVFTDITNVFNNHSPEKIFFQVDENNLNYVTNLAVWGDSDTNFTNDFDSVKALHYGNSTERVVIGGTYSQTPASLTGTSGNLTITGINITTPPNPATVGVTEGTLYIKIKVPVISTTTTFTAANPIITGTNSSIVIYSPTSTVTTKSSTLKLVTIAVPFDTTTKVTSASFGTIKVLLTFTSQTISPTQNPVSPIVKTTLLNAKSQAYRYGLFVNSIGGASGISVEYGNKAIVALGSGVFGGTPTKNQTAGTLMHEIGHNLGLNHGGPNSKTDANINCKPNYASIMSYSRQLPTYLGSKWVLDYSEGAVQDLTENNLPATVPVFTPRTGVTAPYITWGTPSGTFTSTATNSKLFNKIQTVNPASGTMDWKGIGSPSGSGSPGSPISGFGITGCSETTAQTAAYHDYYDWSNLYHNFQTGAAGASAFSGAGGNDNSGSIFSSGDDDITPPPHADINTNVIVSQQSQSAVYPGLIPPPNTDGSTSIKSGSNLPLKFQYLVSGTTVTQPQGVVTTANNFIGYNNPSAIAPYVVAFACPNTACTGDPNTSTNGLIAAKGTWKLNLSNPSNEIYQFDWKTPAKVKKNTTYYISIYVLTPGLTTTPAPLKSVYFPLLNSTTPATMIVTLTP